MARPATRRGFLPMRDIVLDRLPTACHGFLMRFPSPPRETRFTPAPRLVPARLVPARLILARLVLAACWLPASGVSGVGQAAPPAPREAAPREAAPREAAPREAAAREGPARETPDARPSSGGRKTQASHKPDAEETPASGRRHDHRSPGRKPLTPTAKDPTAKPEAKPRHPPAAASTPAHRPLPGEPAEPSNVPRFAALKTDETNMRVGPGQRYPIEWVYRRRDLPVEVEKEYDVWRYVRDHEGIRGWVHQVTLSERRTFMIRGARALLRADPNDQARQVAILEVGVIGRLRSCDKGSQWCQVQVGGHKGYLRRDQLWGLLPDEVVTPS